MDKSSGVDVYQKRYLTHQEYKLGASGSKSIYTFAEAHAILAALNNRQSCRVFGEDRINPYVLKKIYEAARNAPSSCNRKAIKIITVVDPSEIGMLSNLLVGGANWLSMAEVVLLLFADMIAYKSPSEIDFMPYLDAGFLAENIYIACEALGVGTCFVNPNIRKENQDKFSTIFGKDNYRFCGAMAIGNISKERDE